MRTTARAAATCALSALLVLCVVAFPNKSAKADTLTVSPPKFELFGNPGDTVTEKIKVTNSSDAPVTYQTEAVDFTASGDQGGIEINEDPNAPKTNFSLEKWITLEPSRLTVAAGESKYINVTIKIPKTGEPGGHYATIQVKLGGENTVAGGAAVQSRLNTLLLLRVSGNITESLKVDSFKANQNYYQSGPVAFEMRSTNSGNVHVAPTGTIVITDMFNRKVKELPLTAANVLPGSSRNVATTWTDGMGPGRYTATLVGEYGQSNKQQFSATTSFIVFPLVLLWTVLGAIALIAFLVTQRKGVKRFINKLTSD